ncbi:subtilisin-like protease SBT3 [Typha angustifolia]|uniref:subtilisin-like protease SBT3 n=1 Tax=Typha angustifolia TaxID=59011 RepID=UPI003C2BEF00
MDVSAMPAPFATHGSWYSAILSSLSADYQPTHLYTYTHVMHGFSAILSQLQLQQLQQITGHLAAFPDAYAELHTTHTPVFLRLSSRGGGLWPASNFGEGVIIGIIDTGIWPESDSFRDEGMPPAPERWNGKCENSSSFNSSLCNQKLIGARSFSRALKHAGLNISSTYDYDSPRDYYGHGSHTSSTAAGSRAPNASYFGYAGGTATGIAPRAWVAMYKAIFSGDIEKTAATDVLAAMDQAIADGVDVMSLSLGFPETDYYSNVIALGAFAAMEKGIFVACSAGNRGSDGYTVSNGAPWITTVGAGTIDRDYPATIILGNGSKSIQGRSLYLQSKLISDALLYYSYHDKDKESCTYHALKRKAVAGKIVFCSASGDIMTQMSEVYRSRALGAIFATKIKYHYLDPQDFYMPFVIVSLQDGEVIKKHITAANKPTVSIQFISTELGLKPAPLVADFSSRGPSSLSPGILKPDILAPGVNVLAAWVPNNPVLQIDNDTFSTDYMLLSGTSMSSPHVVGVAALLRALHKDWTPAAIRSAMMTTADLIDNSGKVIIDMVSSLAASPLDFGGGHVNPNQAMDPGLVYDIVVEDYIDFLCGLNYTNYQISLITRNHKITCSSRANLDLNYPSFIVILNNTETATQTFKRILTNVGDSPTSYRAVVDAPSGMKVAVIPQMLSFENKYSKQEFSVTVEINLEGKARVHGDYIGNYGFLRWYEDGGKHVVRSPIVSAYLAQDLNKS